MRNLRQFVWLSFLLLAAIARGQGNSKLEFGIIDIGAIVSPIDDARVDDWSLPIRSSYRNRDRDSENSKDSEARDTVSADYLLRFIRDTIQPDSWELEGRSMQISESGIQLIVRQDPEILSELRNFVAAFTRVCRRSLTLDAVIVTGGSGAFANLVSAGSIIASRKFDSIRRGQSGELRMVAGLNAQALNGQRVRMQAGRLTSFVGDCRVEIAQTASVGDPVAQRLLEGTRLFVRPSVMHDGRINLRVQGEITTDLELANFETRSTTIGGIQLPSIKVNMFTASAAVSSGDAVVVGAIRGGDEQSRFLVLRATTTSSDDLRYGSGADITRAYDIGYLTRPHLAVPRLSLGRGVGGPGVFQEWEDDRSAFSGDRWFMSADEVHDMIRQVVTPEFWADNIYRLESSGGWLWVTAGNDQHRGVDELMRRLTSTRGRIVSIETQVLSIASQDLANLRSKGGEWLRQLLRSPATIRQFSVVGSAELDGRVEWTSGREYAYLFDYDPEVAQGAEISEPRIETGFEGLYLRCAPFSVGQAGDLGLSYQVELSGEIKEMPEFTGDGTSFGRIQIPNPVLAESAGQITCKSGAYSLLAEFPSPDNPKEVTVVIARLRL